MLYIIWVLCIFKVSLIKQKGWDTYAQELSKPQSEKIRKVLGRNRVFNGDFEKIKLRKNFFDVVTFWHVLEHVKYPGKTISKTQALLKNNGFVFIEVPNINSLICFTIQGKVWKNF